MAADVSYARKLAKGTGRQLFSIPESAVALDEAIVPLADVLAEIDRTTGSKDVKPPGGSSQINASNRATIDCADDLGEYLDWRRCSTFSVCLPINSICITETSNGSCGVSFKMLLAWFSSRVVYHGIFCRAGL